MPRIIDLILSIMLLILLAPVFTILIIFLLIFQGRPIFFFQDRVGLYSNTFKIIKFRTMSLDSAYRGVDAGSFDAGSQQRVTGVGRWLRRSKLDELPQLINVLLGSMSLVGPRPEVRKWVKYYPDLWSKVHTVRPGITDPASVIYRNEEEVLSVSNDPEKVYKDELLPHKLSLYIEYVDTRSFYGDIKIILKTFLVLFR